MVSKSNIGFISRLGAFKLIRGDPGRPDGWIPPDLVVDGEERVPHTGHPAPQLLLFNLDDDPHERTNLASDYPAITAYLGRLLDSYQAGMVAPDVAGLVQEANPVHYGGKWSSGWCNISMVDNNSL